MFLNLLEPLVNAAARRRATRDLAKLKALLEAGREPGRGFEPT
jgi:hypothetical protein